VGITFSASQRPVLREFLLRRHDRVQVHLLWRLELQALRGLDRHGVEPALHLAGLSLGLDVIGRNLPAREEGDPLAIAVRRAGRLAELAPAVTHFAYADRPGSLRLVHDGLGHDPPPRLWLQEVPVGNQRRLVLSVRARNGAGEDVGVPRQLARSREEPLHPRVEPLAEFLTPELRSHGQVRAEAERIVHCGFKNRTRDRVVLVGQGLEAEARGLKRD
jgi:hypothetical protein